MWFLVIFNFFKRCFNWIIEHPTLTMAFYGIIVTCIMLFAIRSCTAQKEEAKRLENNQMSLMSDLEHFKTQSGKDAAKIMSLELTQGEFEKLCNDQTKVIKDLKLKVKHLESISTTGTVTNVEGITNIRDSIVIIYKDSIRQENLVKYFEWSDKWNKISGVIENDIVKCSYNGADTLNIVLYKVPKRCLFRWAGTKYVEAYITNSNPSTKIVYNRTIRLVKKK